MTLPHWQEPVRAGPTVEPEEMDMVVDGRDEVRQEGGILKNYDMYINISLKLLTRAN